jgi:6-phosphofructokinase 1
MANQYDVEVLGVRRGFSGLIEGDFVEMDRRSVSSILEDGGTVLKSGRCEAFYQKAQRAVAARRMRESNMDALVVIGGEGSLQGTYLLNKEHDIPVVGCPGTIDNDLFGTDTTIGYDTAINSAIKNLDRIRDTADAHDRLFLVEVMGRDAGFIALHAGIGAGAELVLLPETSIEMDEVKERIESLMATQTRSSVVIVAEGEELGGAGAIGNALKNDPAFSHIEIRVVIFGHTQRGGAPTARDRVLASRLGVAAVEVLLDGHTNVMVGVVAGETKLTPIKNIGNRRKQIDYDLVRLIDVLS